MDAMTLARATFALLFTLGLVGIAAVLLRRFGPGAALRLPGSARDRRMKVIETR